MKKITLILFSCLMLLSCKFNFSLVVDDIKQFQVYPPYDISTEHNELIISAKSDVGNIKKVFINDEEIKPEKLNDWQHTVPLTAGINTFSIRFQIGLTTYQETRKVSYYGPFLKGSEGLFKQGNTLVTRAYQYDNSPYLLRDLDTSVSRLFYLKDVISIAADDVLNDESFYYTLAYSPSLVEHQLIKINTSDLSGSVLVSSKNPLFNGSSQLSHLTFNADKTALYFTQDKNLFRYQLNDASLSLVKALTYPTADYFYPNHFIIDENKNRVLLEADWRIDTPYKRGSNLYVADLTGAQAGTFTELTASNQAGCTALPTDDLLNQIEYSNSIYSDKVYISYDSTQQTLASFDLTTDCFSHIANLNDLTPNLTDDSLQGIDFDPSTQTIYLGHYSTTSAYHIDEKTLRIIEPQGFIKDANPAFEPSFVMYDKPRDTLYFSASEHLIQWDLKKSQQTILYSSSNDITGISQSADGKTLYFGNDSDEIGSWDLDKASYQLLDEKAPYDTEYVTVIDENTLAFFDSDKLYTYNLTDKTYTLLSDAKTDGIRIWRNSWMLHDATNQRLIINAESDSKYRFVAINTLDGSRTYLNSQNPIERHVNAFDLSADGKSIIYEHKENLCALNLSDESSTLINERLINGFAMPGPEAMAVRDRHTLFVADATLNGFWLVNTLTGQRTLIH